HLAADALVVGLAEERAQRREGAVHEQLEVADLAGREVPRGPVGGGGLQLGGPLGVDDEVDERAAVGGDEVIRQVSLRGDGSRGARRATALRRARRGPSR